MQIVINDKSKKVFIVLKKDIPNMTNDSDEQDMVIYEDLSGKKFVKAMDEFYFEFSPVDGSDIKFVDREFQTY